MANLLLADYTSALKEILLPYIRDNFPKQTILLDQFKRNAGVQLINNEFVFPLYTQRHGGIASLATDGSEIIQSGGRDTSRGTVSVKRHTASLDISDLSIRASKGGQLAVESALAGQTARLSEDFARQVNRQIYSDGIGAVSQVRTTGGSVGAGTAALEQQDSNLDDGRSIDWYGTINGDISPTKYLAPDQILGIGTGAADLGTVTSVTGTSVVMTGSPAIAASDSVYVVDGSGIGAGSAEIEGIRAALSSSSGTSTYAGVARNTNGWLPQFGSASEALTLKRLYNTYVSAREFGAPREKYIILVNKTLYIRYGDLLTAMRRTVDETDLLGGWTGLEFAAGGGVVGLFLDYDVPDGEALVINLDSWSITQVAEPEWLEEKGDLLRKQNTILYQAVMVWYANVVCLAPAANGRQTRKSD